MSDVVLGYLNRLRRMGPSMRLSADIDEVLAERMQELARRAGVSVDELCHCGQPVNVSELRNRGMCTFCDDVRCDAYPGECGR